MEQNSDLPSLDETWKEVEGFPGYWVSNAGRVRKGDKLKKLTKGRNGYLCTGMTKDRKCKTVLVHRLVAEAFLPKQEFRTAVNHKDGAKNNNTIFNLEWVTYKENAEHSVAAGLHKAPKALSNREVRAAQALRDLGMPVPEIGRIFDVSDATIYRSTNAKDRFTVARN